MALASSALVAAESILALTPVAIKKTPLDAVSAIWSRTLTSTGLGYALTGDRTIKQSELPAAGLLGYLNLLHIASSYESFRHLPAGQAMSILYTYPMWNMIFGAYFSGEKVRPMEWLYMSVAFIGSLILNAEPGTAVETVTGGRPNPTWGIFMAVLMALSEAGMHTVLKSVGWLDPAKSVWLVNMSASLFLTGFTGISGIFGTPARPKTGATLADAAALTAFHSFSMFSGYWLRFYAVPRLSTVTYSILSYAGLLASYLFGLAFLGEKPGWMSLVGAALIVAGGVLLQTLPKNEENKQD
jgi:drug/metabolite transporter (DMT)-like permease